MALVCLTTLEMITNSWNNLTLAVPDKKNHSFDVSDLCKIAGYISNNPDDENYFNKDNLIEIKDIKRNDRFIQYGLAASKMAREDVF